MSRSKFGPRHPRVLFDTAKLMTRVVAKCQVDGLTWTDLAPQIGISKSMLSHLNRNRVSAPGGHALVSLLDWLGETDNGPYMIRTIDLSEDDQ
jgi:hypothetical protein